MGKGRDRRRRSKKQHEKNQQPTIREIVYKIDSVTEAMAEAKRTGEKMAEESLDRISKGLEA